MSAWRCFVAVPLRSELRERIQDVVAGWESMSDESRVRWTDVNGWHVTLAFLGRIDSDCVPALADRLERVVAAAPSFEIRIDGVGVYPAPRAACVVVLRLCDEDRRLAHLAEAVRRAVEVEDRSPFRAHVTLARTRREAPQDLHSWLSSVRAPRGVVHVDSVGLFRSHLRSGRARYESLAMPLLADRSPASA